MPMDWIRQFLFRPKAVIPRSDYIRHARSLARRAKEIKEEAAALRREEQTLGKGRKWKRKLNELNKVCMELEEDEQDLLEVFPQGEDADTAWVLTVVTYYAKLVLGALCVVVSLMLLIHVVLYVFISPPVHPFLNEMFIALDKTFPLFGVGAFAFFCFYLIAITVKGCTKFGVNFVIFAVHPMQPGKTMMSSFMFNMGVILLASTSVVQFCARAFALYAGDTAIERISGTRSRTFGDSSTSTCTTSSSFASSPCAWCPAATWSSSPRPRGSASLHNRVREKRFHLYIHRSLVDAHMQ